MNFNRLLVLGLLLNLSTPTAAQFKTIAEGPQFNEYEEGYSKVLQLKNGNTIYLNFTIHDGIDVQMYDASFKRTQEKRVVPAYGKLRGGDVDAVFESGGHVTVLLSERTNRHPILRRLVLDGTNGAIRKEDVVLDLDNRTRKGKQYSSGSSSDFFVVVDNASGCYAVHTAKNDKDDDGWEYIHYSADHRVISRADNPGTSKKVAKTNCSYKDMVVMGEQRLHVFVSAAVFDSNEKKISSDVRLMTLEKGTSEFKFEPLKFPNQKSRQGGLLKYNPHTGQLVVVLQNQIDEGSYYTYNAYLGLYNPETKQMAPARLLQLGKLNVKSEELFGRKDHFTGKPQNVFIRKDGSFSVVFEENEVSMTSSGGGSSHRTYYHSILGDLAVVNFDKDGKEHGTWYAPKRLGIYEMLFPNFYHKLRENTAEWMQIGNQYKFFNFISSPTGDYLLINDRHNSRELIAKGKADALWKVSNCSAFYIKVEGKGLMPEREPVFTKPDGSDAGDMGIFIISDYDPVNNRYATVRTTAGRHSKSRIVWLQPQ